ncbi:MULTISPECIES: hypothetical protein [Saccharothrix]|nr:hypothetical protein [Saccharothrix sp. CB00851]
MPVDDRTVFTAIVYGLPSWRVAGVAAVIRASVPTAHRRFTVTRAAL